MSKCEWLGKSIAGWFAVLLRCAGSATVRQGLSLVFDSETLAAFTSLVCSRFDAAMASAAKQNCRKAERSAYTRRCCGDILRSLHSANQDVAAYLSLAGETGLTEKDCLVIVTLLLKSDKPHEAVDWVEMVLEIEQRSSRGFMHRYELSKLKREVLVKQKERGNS